MNLNKLKTIRELPRFKLQLILLSKNTTRITLDAKQTDHLEDNLQYKLYHSPIIEANVKCANHTFNSQVDLICRNTVSDPCQTLFVLISILETRALWVCKRWTLRENNFWSAKDWYLPYQWKWNTMFTKNNFKLVETLYASWNNKRKQNRVAHVVKSLVNLLMIPWYNGGMWIYCLRVPLVFLL